MCFCLSSFFSWQKGLRFHALIVLSPTLEYLCRLLEIIRRRTEVDRPAAIYVVKIPQTTIDEIWSLPCIDNEVERPSFQDENDQGQTSDRRSYFVGGYDYKRPVTDCQWRNLIGTTALLRWRLTPPNLCRLYADGSSEGNNASTSEHFRF